MKVFFRVITICLLSIFVLTAVHGQIIPKTDTDSEYDTGGGEDISSRDIPVNHNSSNLLMAGDSITHRFETTGIDAWEKYLQQYQPVNYGVDGDTTWKLLDRLEHSPPDSTNPDVCTILIGINDLIAGENPVTVAQNIQNISRLVSDQYPDSRIYLFCIFPIGKNPGKIRDLINETNSILKNTDYPDNVHVIDISHEFIGENGVLIDIVLMDELHLNKNGYEIWGRNISQLINDSGSIQQEDKTLISTS